MTEESKKGGTSTDCILSNDIVNLYKSASVKNVNEAVTVLFHAFLLESFFIPKDTDKDKYGSMPENWNKTFTIKYVHHCCPSFTCCVRCVPLYSTVSVHGIVCDVDCSESIDFKVNVKKYLKQKSNFSDVFEVFSNLDELSRLFKDNFVLPLLNLLHETVGKRPLFGMRGLVDEAKMHILECLPVRSVLNMSLVNKDFNSLANTDLLWKHLFQRDFSKGTLYDTGTSSRPNWKQIYKKEYLKKRRSEPRGWQLMPRRYNIPEHLIVDPDTDIGIHFDPPLPGIYLPFSDRYPPFPGLRPYPPIFPPSHPFPRGFP